MRRQALIGRSEVWKHIRSLYSLPIHVLSPLRTWVVLQHLPPLAEITFPSTPNFAHPMRRNQPNVLLYVPFPTEPHDASGWGRSECLLWLMSLQVIYPGVYPWLLETGTLVWFPRRNIKKLQRIPWMRVMLPERSPLTSRWQHHGGGKYLYLLSINYKNFFINAYN